MMNKHKNLYYFSIILIIAIGCGYPEDKIEAQVSVDQFVMNYNKKQFKEIRGILRHRKELLREIMKLYQKHGKIKNYQLLDSNISKLPLKIKYMASKDGMIAKTTYAVKFENDKRKVYIRLFKDLTGLVDDTYEITNIEILQEISQ